MIIIGSKALYYQLKQEGEERFFKSDFDVIMSLSDFSAWTKANKPFIKKLMPTQGNKYKAIVQRNGVRMQYEIELTTEGTSSRFLLDHADQVCDGAVKGFFDETYQALRLTYQMLTKRSHLIYPVHFEKNMADYQLIKSILSDVERDEKMDAYYTLRFNEAKERYKQKTPKLNVTTEDFFSSKLNVKVYFIHDHLHELMAHHDRPVYTMMQRDSSKAWCEKDMFFDLPYDYQVQCVQEEAYVIALERYVIPQYGEDWNDYFESYKKALKRICTTLTSGWFRDFAIENYNEAVERFNPGYVDIFRDALATGNIQPKKGVSREEVPVAV